jgi:hypothetical protein
MNMANIVIRVPVMVRRRTMESAERIREALNTQSIENAFGLGMTIAEALLEAECRKYAIKMITPHGEAFYYTLRRPKEISRITGDGVRRTINLFGEQDAEIVRFSRK